jgi:hypothetical protein
MLFFLSYAHSQTTVSGSVSDSETQEPLPSANVVIQGTNEGTFSDFDGNFTLETDIEPPFSLEISSVGFAVQIIEVTSSNQSVNAQLNFGQNLQEIIISASRKKAENSRRPCISIDY